MVYLRQLEAMLKSKITIAKIIIAAAVMFSLPAYSLAAGLVPCGGPSPEQPCTVYDIFGVALKFASLAMAFGGILAVFWIIYNGFGLVTSQGNQEAVGKYRQGITNAVVGFVLIIISFAIINTVVSGIFNLSSKYNPLTNPRCYINPTLSGCDK